MIIKDWKCALTYYGIAVLVNSIIAVLFFSEIGIGFFAIVCLIVDILIYIPFRNKVFL